MLNQSLWVQGGHCGKFWIRYCKTTYFLDIKSRILDLKVKKWCWWVLVIDIYQIPKFHMFTNNEVQNYSRCTKKFIFLRFLKHLTYLTMRRARICNFQDLHRKAVFHYTESISLVENNHLTTLTNKILKIIIFIFRFLFLVVFFIMLYTFSFLCSFNKYNKKKIYQK